MYSGLVAALLIALVLTFISAFLLRRTGPWGSAWSFFLVIFLALWAVAIYIAPVGPIYQGVAWAPLVIAGVLLAILLIASMPNANDWRDSNIKEDSKRESSALPKPINRFFWVLLVLLAAAVMIGMMNPQKAL